MSVDLAASPSRPAPRASTFWRQDPADLRVVAAGALGTAAVSAAWVVAARGGALPHLALALLTALHVWWGSNTVAHIHLHAPLFRARALNRAFSLFLTVALGVPQSIWRARHLAHHAGRDGEARLWPLPRRARAEVALLAAVWATLLAAAPTAFLVGTLPGLALGLALCHLQGVHEHLGPTGPAPDGVDHHGRLHNLLWFNDGFHAQHHATPRMHWRRLPHGPVSAAPAFVSTRSPLGRALARPGQRAVGWALGCLERLAFASGPLRRALVGRHARAIARLLGDAGLAPTRALVVGGGLFPRTALALRSLWPRVELTLVDLDAGHLAEARAVLVDAAEDHGVRLVEGAFTPDLAAGHDLVVVPLAFEGERGDLGRLPCPALVHEWLWRRSAPESVVVSWWLCKRLTLLRP